MNESRTRIECVSLLEELALLLELGDGIPFRIRAVQNGARVLDGLQGDLATLAADGTLQSTKGIGKGLMDLIEEYLSTGTIAEVQSLRTTVPPGVVSLTSLRGVGAKKAKALYEQLGIASIGELEYACKENRLIELKGFGVKTQAAMLAAIDTWNAAQGKCRLPLALAIARSVCSELLSLGAATAETAGQVRRHGEVVDEIVVVWSDCSVDVVTVHFAGECQDDTVSFLRDGVRVRAIHAEPHDFVRTLFRQSAAEAFLAAVDAVGSTDGMTSEEDLFARIGWSYVPVEMRESAECAERARQGTIPDAVRASDMRGMLHLHTEWSDGADTIRAMALRCKEMGYTYVAICDHSKTAVYAQGLSVERVKAQHREIDALNNEDLGISILKGIESDILPDGSLDYDDDILELFDVVVASVHSAFRLDKDKQTERIVRAIRNPYTTILGHPTGRLLLARDGYPLDMERILEAAAATGTVIELNANPYRLDLDWRWHGKAVQRGIRIAINPDSHQKETLDEVEYGIGIARKGMLRAVDTINTLELDAFLAFARELRARKAMMPR
ncbi:MAG: PHP domain-containing protein [Candidatus Kapaibacterium sp.]